MDAIKFLLAGFVIMNLRLLLFPICLIFLILSTPVYFIVKDKETKRVDKFLEIRDTAFNWLFGPPFGFFSVALVFYISLIYGVIYIW